MSEITQIRLPGGEIVWARVSGKAHPHDVGFADRVGALAVEEFGKLTSAVVSNVRNAVREHKADEVSIEFGIELAVHTGKVIGVLAEASASSNIVVHLTWHGDAPDGVGDDAAKEPGTGG